MYEQERFDHEDSSTRHINKQVEHLTYRMSYRDIIPAQDAVTKKGFLVPFVIIEKGVLGVVLKEVR